MKKLLFIVVTAFLTMLGSNTQAAAENTPAAVPKNLHVWNTAGDTYVDLVSSGCSYSRYRLSPSHAKYDTIVSILMAAQISGHKVVIRFDGCNSVNQGTIVGVYLQ